MWRTFWWDLYQIVFGLLPIDENGLKVATEHVEPPGRKSPGLGRHYRLYANGLSLVGSAHRETTEQGLGFLGGVKPSGLIVCV